MFDKGKEYADKGRTQWTEYLEKGKGVVQNQSEAVQAAVEKGKEAYVSKTNEGPLGGEDLRLRLQRPRRTLQYFSGPVLAHRPFLWFDRALRCR